MSLAVGLSTLASGSLPRIAHAQTHEDSSRPRSVSTSAQRHACGAAMSESTLHVKPTRGFDGAFLLDAVVRRIPGVRHTQCLGDALRIFADHPPATAIAVLADEMPIGIICWNLIADVVRLPCYRASIGRENCMLFVSRAPNTLSVDTNVAELARALARERHRTSPDPFVVTRNGAYLGIVESQALALAISGMRRTTAAMQRGHALAPEYGDDIPSADFPDPCHGIDSYPSRLRDH
ncbi:hypothetical protein [Cupriavidus sp. RAF12]|uniref:hypothetical protein n=1 Tax=Cupriavidus sp. RAF12 TaxID=3233050 RepID=UPI003F933175